jgi:AcrR family transcriptional regulator
MLAPMCAAEPAAEAVSPKRDHLMATAWRLFYRDGYRAVGIDTLLAEAGVAKMTLYNHFDSKEALIVAVLEKRSAALLASVKTSMTAAGHAPARQLQAAFDGLHRLFAADEFKGCGFLRALSEYPEPDHPIHRTAWKHKLAFRALFAELAANAGVRHPAAFADTVGMLVDGAIVAAHATGKTDPADTARAAAVSLLKIAGG